MTALLVPFACTACVLTHSAMGQAPPAVVLYLEEANVLDDCSRVNGNGLLVLLDYLAHCSPLQQQQTLNDLALLLERSYGLRSYLLSTPSWQPRLLRLLQPECADAERAGTCSTPHQASQTHEGEGCHGFTAAPATDTDGGAVKTHSRGQFLRTPSVVTWASGITASVTLDSQESSHTGVGELARECQDVARPVPQVQAAQDRAEAGGKSCAPPSPILSFTTGRDAAPGLHVGIQASEHHATTVQREGSTDTSPSRQRQEGGSASQNRESARKECIREDSTSALVGLVSKMLNVVAHDMMLVTNGWRVLAHCLAALRQATLFSPRQCSSASAGGTEGSEVSDGARIVRGMVFAACKAVKAALRGAERWDSVIELSGLLSDGSDSPWIYSGSPPSSSISMVALRDNIGGLLATVYAADIQGPNAYRQAAAVKIPSSWASVVGWDAVNNADVESLNPMHARHACFRNCFAL